MNNPIKGPAIEKKKKKKRFSIAHSNDPENRKKEKNPVTIDVPRVT